MKILYYLEPRIELGQPLFRLGTVRNHLEPEIGGLLLSPERSVEVSLICSEPIAAAIHKENRLPGVRLWVFKQAELEAVYPDYLEASARFYNRDYPREQLARSVELYRRKLAGYEPDVIVCYESSAPFLAELYPRALFLHSTLGIFSRPPFPETSALDPFGIGKDSYLARCGAELCKGQLDGSQCERIARLKAAYQRAQVEWSPVERGQVRGGFERVALLPLQVSRYFMFDENLPLELKGVDQLGLLEHVLERSDPQVGIAVTMHRVDAKVLTPERCQALRGRFPNFLYDPALQQVPWPSQHLLPHVDAVISVSSAVGLLAMVWDLPVIALGRSHLAGIAASRTLDDLSALVSQPSQGARDAVLYHLLTRYYPQMDRFHHRAEWFVPFLEDCLSRKDSPCTPGYFREIAEPERVFEGLIQGLRPAGAELSKKGRGLPALLPGRARSLRSKIQQSDVVSFDVFDTLVTRPLSEPGALFGLIAARASTLFRAHGIDPADFGGFVELRKRAAKAAAREAREHGSEEYNLTLVYAWLVNTVGAPQSLVPELKALEEQAEVAISLPREAGREAFQMALGLRKRILLISDTYLDSQVVADIVKRAGYAQYERLFVSSDLGKLKSSGTLYAHIRQLVPAELGWLHVGDNRLSDVRVPERLGIAAHHEASATTRYARDSLVRSVFTQGELTRHLGAQITHGVIARKFFDRAESTSREARFGGSPYRLGYEAGGPLFVGFSKWVLDQARRDGITDLYFLARDGLIPRKVCELLPQEATGAPATHYVWASRRAYVTAAMETPSDVLQALDLLFRTAKLRTLWLQRFGLEESRLLAGSLSAAGFASFDEEIQQSNPADMARLRDLVQRNMDVILAQAAVERKLLQRYLAEVGLTDPRRRVALVDLGHNASLQVALARLLGRNDLRGYYFATFDAARAPYMAGHQIESYLLQFELAALSSHPYARNLGLFEFLFLPDERSFMHFKAGPAQELEPVFAEADEARRCEVVAEVHRGALDFARDASHACLGDRAALEMSKTEATKSFCQFAADPDLADAALLTGVGFASGLGSAELHYVIAPAHYGRRQVVESWWKTGAEVTTGLKSRGLSARLERATGWQRKLQKLQRDPKRFILDMRLVQRLRDFID